MYKAQGTKGEVRMIDLVLEEGDGPAELLEDGFLVRLHLVRDRLEPALPPTPRRLRGLGAWDYSLAPSPFALGAQGLWCSLKGLVSRA